MGQEKEDEGIQFFHPEGKQRGAMSKELIASKHLAATEHPDATCNSFCSSFEKHNPHRLTISHTSVFLCDFTCQHLKTLCRAVFSNTGSGDPLSCTFYSLPSFNTPNFSSVRGIKKLITAVEDHM